jgi:hypothetical protein
MCVCVCMFEINSLTPQPIQTKFCVATIQNTAENIGYIRIHTFIKMHNNGIVSHCYVYIPLTDSNQILCGYYSEYAENIGYIGILSL